AAFPLAPLRRLAGVDPARRRARGRPTAPRSPSPPSAASPEWIRLGGQLVADPLRRLPPRPPPPPPPTGSRPAASPCPPPSPSPPFRRLAGVDPARRQARGLSAAARFP